MLTKRLVLLFLQLFSITLMPAVSSAGNQRWQEDNSIRGNSFGLEKFLFQGFQETNIDNGVRDVKRIRPAGSYKIVRNDPYETDSLSVIGFITTRPQVTSSASGLNYPTYESPVAAEAVKDETVTTLPEFPAQVTTERTTKRGVMRRRKRPPQVIQKVLNEGISENKTWKYNRDHSSTPPPRITLRSTLAPTRSSEYSAMKLTRHSRPGNLKAPVITTTLVPESSQEERVQNLEITKISEQSTTSTVVRNQPTPKFHQQPSIKLTTEKSTTINLKEFLKQQTETLSLSELLQTQNLSLADLLRGNKDASAILKAKQLVSTTDESKKNQHVLEPITEASESKYQEVETPKNSIAVETTTIKIPSKRIFPKSSSASKGHQPSTKSPGDKVPSEENLKTTKRTSLYTLNLETQNRINDFRTKLRNNPRKMTTKDLEVTTRIFQKEKEELPSTVPTPAVLKNTEIPSYKSKRIPFKSSNNPELSLIITDKKSDLRDKYPDRIINWTSRNNSTKRPMEERTKQNENLVVEPLKTYDSKHLEPSSGEDPFEIETTTLMTTTTSSQSTTNFPVEVRKTETKDDLIELLRSGHSADALKKILDSRNMTLQEVLHNREKSTVHSNIEELFSSPQVNFTTPSTLDTKFNVKKTESMKAEEGLQQPVLKVSKSSVHLGQTNGVENREPKHYSLPIASIHEESIFNFKPDDLAADKSNTENMALWKLSDKSILYGSTFANGGPLAAKHVTDRSMIYQRTELPIDDDAIILLETIERNQEAERKFRLGLNNSDDVDKFFIPPAVKSAIIASGVVMGLAILIFVAIFAACGWRQRRIRLKGSSSFLSQTLTRSEEKPKRTNTLTPVNFNDGKSYKKTIEFDDESSESGTSASGSYLWSSIKNTFNGRAKTLKTRFEKEAKSREEKLTSRDNENKRKLRSRQENTKERITYEIQEEKTNLKKIDRDRNVLNTSLNFKRSSAKDNYFDESPRRY